MNSYGAREYFSNANLTYADIQPKDLYLLRNMIAWYVEASGLMQNTFRVNDTIKFNLDKINGNLIEAYIRVRSFNFESREAISFNKNGFIGFCGELDSTHTKPIIDAFIEWVDKIKEQGK